MAGVQKIVPIPDFRQDAAAVLRHVRESQEPMVMTQWGRKSQILQVLAVVYAHANEQLGPLM